MIAIILRYAKTKVCLKLKLLNGKHLSRLTCSFSGKKKREGSYFYVNSSNIKFDSKYKCYKIKKLDENSIDEYPRDKEMYINDTCVVCMDRPSKVILSSCGHLCLCFTCYLKDMILCPLCRMEISNIIVL